MRFTLESDYAIRIVHCLAVSQEKLDANHIAVSSDVSIRFALKILRKLCIAEIIQSYKGVQGGYKLAKEPEKITLKDVIEAVDGKIEVSRCLTQETACSRINENNQTCKFKSIFNEVSQLVRNKLDEVNFRDLIEK